MTVLSLILILLCGADYFRCRESAHFALSKLVAADQGIPALLAAESQSDIEISCRATFLLKPYFRRNAQKMAAELSPVGWCKGKLPWISSLPRDYPNRNKTIDHYLQKVESSGIDYLSYPGVDWRKYRVATYLLMWDLIANRQPVLHLLEKMAIGDWDYLAGRR